jgi:8-oxo-dGTP pyrophosphatase MutT (NUDIX family)
MILLSLEEFSSRRRKAQSDIEDALRPIVRRALDTQTDTSGWSELLDEVANQWRLTYADESGSTRGMPSSFRLELRNVLQHTKRGEVSEATEDRIVIWLATAILSHATMAASDDDPEELFVEWVTMNDTHVREAHLGASGQQRPIGEKFTVGGVKMRYPGDPRAPIELWINCRCTLRPILASEVNAFRSRYLTASFRDVSTEERKKDADAGRALKDGSFPIDNCSDLRNAIQAIGRAKDPTKAKAHIRKRKRALGCPEVDLPESWSYTAKDFAATVEAEMLDEPTHAGIAIIARDTERVLMMQRALDPTDAPEVQGTWEFPGGSLEEDDESPEAGAWREWQEETGLPVPEGETVNGWRSPDGVYQGYVFAVPVEAEAFEFLNPEKGETPNPDDPERETPEVVAWFTIEQVSNLGPALRPEVAKMDWSVFDLSEQEDSMTASADEAPEIIETEDAPESLPPEQVRVPWHGVIAPEGKWSGDRRKFAEGALRARPLPLPLTYQKQSAAGHDGNVTVATIERLTRKDGEVRGSGYMLATPEADEVIGLFSAFGRFGVSVDADDTSFEMNDEEEGVVFTDSRAASACIVAIPAFAEAWCGLGEPDEDFHGEDLAVSGPNDTREALVASMGVEPFVDVAPGRTEDGPGWLTHPVDTDRLRDYWVRGPGAAKIAWGSPGDFDRCRANVAEYVKPQHLNGYCANRHYDALGFWPGRKAHAGEALEFTEASEALSLVASGGHYAPSEWFVDPMLEDVTPLRITEEGEVFGHIAGWSTCHSSWADTCVTPPRSQTNYAYFRLGEVLTDAGPVATGCLTIGGGHAGPGLSMRAALEHYDNSTAAFADVNCGEDSHGIWVHGWVRPGTSEEMVHAARASKPSGDWRYCAATGDLEMIAALSVNTPGFAIPRVAASIHGTRQMSLVAAGYVTGGNEVDGKVDVAALAAAVADEIEARHARRAKMAALAARFVPLTKEDN